MDKNAARRLVKDTFQNPFDKERFQHFSKELLNHFEDASFTYQGNYVPDAYKPYIQTLERIGKYQDPDGIKIDILIANLKKGSSLERARTMQRNFIAWYLNGSRGGEMKDAALVAFVSPESEDWRFSLVKMEYKLDETPTGKVKAKAEYTPARRFSFLVGEHETSHTAQSRLVPLIEIDDYDPTLKQIEEAFNIEKATKEFFEKYRELYLQVVETLDRIIECDSDIKQDFAKKSVNTADFAKKLLGQIVFLYFLQKKGWFGVKRRHPWGSGSKRFVRELFAKEHGSYQNFFNDILEPLFYEALRLDRPEDYYSRFDCRIPFLNGGLFDPLNDYDWIETDILLPDELFSNDIKTKEGDPGTGILDVFDRYNFTVNEDEPLEKEVAVDPEMLGKVFENLLEVKDRKSKGTYYTPREIVHYMCQESLINYLATELEGKLGKDDIENFIRFGETLVQHDTRVVKEGRETKDYSFKLPAAIREHAKLIDAKLETIRICDPAVGSGAFPVGMMSEIIRARNTLSPYLGDGKGRTTYDFKRHAIQECLYGVDIDPGAIEIAKLRLWLSLVVDEEERGTIQPLPNLDYKLVQGNSLLGVERDLFNQQLFDSLEKLKLAFFGETHTNKKHALKIQIDELILKLTKGHRVFDYEVYFSEVFHHAGGFDVIIANPPYVRQEEIKELKPDMKKNFECYTGTADLLVYFYERGVRLLRPGGTIALITSNKYYRAAYGEKLRGFLARELTLHRLIDFGDAPVFEAIAYASILVGVRAAPAEDSSVLAYTWEKEMTFERIALIVPERGQQIRQSELKPDGWRLESTAVLRLLDKLRRSGKPLREFVGARVSRGLTTGLNEAYVVDRATRDRLVREHKSSAEILMPYLRGKDISRWCANFAGQFIIKIESSENKAHPWSGGSKKEAEKIFQTTYPAIHSHFENLRSELIKRADQGKYFWEQRSCKYWLEFSKPKIISTKMSIRPTFTLDLESRYLGNTAYFFPAATSGHYLLGLLNSSLFFTYAKRMFVEKQNGWFEVQPVALELFPIPVVPPDQQLPVTRLVERILSVKQRNPEADVSALEREIDQYIYRLFDLTPDEIKIVEGSND